MKTWILMCAFILLGLSPLYANWGGDAGGNVGTGNFRASGTDQVEMHSENLVIRLYRDHARTSVDYTLTNPGPAVDVTAGFPCLGVVSGNRTNLEIEDYRLAVDGANVPYKTEVGDVRNYKAYFDAELLQIPDLATSSEGGPCRLWWLVSTVHFDAGQTRHAHVQYESKYEFSEGGPSDDCYYNSDYFRYLLSTAAAWKGSIRQGTVTIDAVTVDPKQITIKPKNRFHPAAKGFVWRFTNLKPTLEDNIEICMNNAFFTQMNPRSPSLETSWYSFEGGKMNHVGDGARRFYLNFHGYAATASSQAKGYPVANVGDFDSRTAWVAGRNGGIHESVTLTLKRPDRVDQIGIVPGYAKSKEVYFANNRIRELAVSVNGGAPTRVTLPDEYISFAPYSHKAYQLIDVSGYRGTVRTLTLTVTKVYAGRKFNDTCISEILLRKRLPTKPKIRAMR